MNDEKKKLYICFNGFFIFSAHKNKCFVLGKVQAFVVCNAIVPKTHWDQGAMHDRRKQTNEQTNDEQEKKKKTVR